MKELAVKAFKFMGAVAGVLATVYGLGWGGAIAVNTFFDSKIAKAEGRIEMKITERESKIMAVHRSDMDGLHGKIDLLSEQNSTIIKQNYRMMEMMKKDQQ